MTKLPEAEVQAQTRLKYKGTLFRNNVGAFEAKNGQWVRYGIANESKEMNKNIKSGDLIGWTLVKITPEMVGKTIPVFTSIEVKEEGFCSTSKMNSSHVKAQKNWRDAVLRVNGIAGIIDDAKKANDLYDQWLEKNKQMDLL